jgi:ATP-binding cassette subfamily B protein
MTEAKTTKDQQKHAVSWKDIARFSWNYWRPNKWFGAGSAAMMLLSVSMDAVVPVYTGRIVDAMRSMPGDNEAWRAAWAAFWMFAVLAFLHHALRNGSLFLWNSFAVRSLQGIVTEALHKVQRFSSDWQANTFAGGTVRKITRGMWAMDTFEDTILMGLLPAVTIMIGVTVMLVLHLPAVGLASAVMIAVYCAGSIWISVRVLSPRFKESAAADTKIGAALADIITGNPTVKSFGAETREDALFGDVVHTWRTKAYQAWQTGVAADSARSAFRVGMTTSMMAATIFLWRAGRATPGDIVLVITTFFIISGYLRDIGQHISHLQRSMSDMEDVILFWMREDDVTDAPAAVPLIITSPRRNDMIAFNRVSFRYPGADVYIYKDMEVEIAAGEKVALVGPSGSGKSTLVKLIQRLYNVTEGQIRIDGQDIANVTLESLRKQIALVPQDPILFHRSLAENIAYGSPAASMDDIVGAAKKAFAHEFIVTLPMGYDSLVGERGVKLSGGERQRVAIARAILADAPILILDEATSSLDSVSEYHIQLALEELMRGRTTITIAHRLSTVQKANRILVFDNGCVVEQGSHASLMATPRSHYRKLYEMQALGLVGTGRPEFHQPLRIEGEPEWRGGVVPQ